MGDYKSILGLFNVTIHAGPGCQLRLIKMRSDITECNKKIVVDFNETLFEH